jgi:hypothetical protein
MRRHGKRSTTRRGSILLVALVFLILVGALASAICAYSVGNVRLGAADSQSARALLAAESGMSFLLLQLRMTPMPIILEGSIDKMSSPSTLWAGTNIEALGTTNNGIAVQLAAAINNCGSFVKSGTTVVVPAGLNPLTTPPIIVDRASGDNSCFTLTVEWDSGNPRPTSSTSAANLVLHLTSVGQCGQVTRKVTMDVMLQKTLRYAVYSNIAIQLGKNTMVTGDVVSKMTTFTKGPPVWSLSDFTRLTGQSALDSKLETFRDLLVANDPSHSNRLQVRGNPAVKALADAQGFTDHNGDGFVDDYDVFLNHLDPNGTNRITQSQYTASNGKPMDAQLFVLLDTLNPPYLAGGTPRPGLTYNTTPDPNSALNQWLGIVDNVGGYDGDGRLDLNDSYAKVLGTVKVRVGAKDWENWANDTSSSGGAQYELGYREQLQGPIVSPDPSEPPVQFNYASSDTQDLTPQSFDTTSYKQKAGTKGNYSGVIPVGATVSDYVIGYSNANSGKAVEASPQGAANPQATYERPVFKNVKFVNCKIAKGTNALFQNCTFEGVTYVDMQTNITDTNGTTTTNDPNKGMTWSKKMKSGTFSSTTTLKSTNSYGFSEGNNLRFEACQVNGPMAAAVPSAYTHFANNWEFSGSTVFNNTSDPTATILAPNTNIDCGSFLAPPTGPLPTSSVLGVIVGGNVNMRGGAWNVDGSIIITGNGGMNTTLGYFGPDDAATDPHAIPAGGFGRICLRYNPTRAMPDGIYTRLTLIRLPQTYQIH